jgi:hypothetical protein
MVEKMDKVGESEVDKSELIKLEFLMYPEKPVSGIEYSR